MEKESKKNAPLNNYLKYSGIGFQMIGTLLLAAWGGRKLDTYFNNKIPGFTIGLMLFAVISSLYLVIKSLTGNNNNKNNEG